MIGMNWMMKIHFLLYFKNNNNFTNHQFFCKLSRHGIEIKFLIIHFTPPFLFRIFETQNGNHSFDWFNLSKFIHHFNFDLLLSISTSYFTNAQYFSRWFFIGQFSQWNNTPARGLCWIFTYIQCIVLPFWKKNDWNDVYFIAISQPFQNGKIGNLLCLHRKTQPTLLQWKLNKNNKRNLNLNPIILLTWRQVSKKLLW